MRDSYSNYQSCAKTNITVLVYIRQQRWILWIKGKEIYIQYQVRCLNKRRQELLLQDIAVIGLNLGTYYTVQSSPVQSGLVITFILPQSYSILILSSPLLLAPILFQPYLFIFNSTISLKSIKLNNQLIKQLKKERMIFNNDIYLLLLY